MTTDPIARTGDEVDLRVLDEIQRRVLWLAVRIVDAANHDRCPAASSTRRSPR